MSHTIFLGNLPSWVTADDIRSWLTAENLVADQIKVIRNPETQESKGFAFIEAPNQEEMQAIIRRFDRAPLEDRLLRANPAQPPRGKRASAPPGPGQGAPAAAGPQDRPARRGGARRPSGPAGAEQPQAGAGQARRDRGDRGGRGGSGNAAGGSQSAFAQELAKAL